MPLSMASIGCADVNTSRIAVPVSFFFDYICPFCYIGSVRLLRVGDRFPLQIRWRFVEIHPNNPVGGQALSELGYSAEHWALLQENMQRMVEEDGIPMAPRTFTTNSRRALLLAMATLELRPDRFPALHQELFTAYFVEGRNIGDPDVLTELAERHQVDSLLATAWDSPEYLAKLLQHVQAAQALQINGVPALQVGQRIFNGAISIETLEQALEQHSS